MIEDGAPWSYAYSEDHRLTSCGRAGRSWTLAHDANGTWRNQTAGGTTNEEAGRSA